MMKWVALLMVAGGAIVGGLAASGESIAVVLTFAVIGAVAGSALLAPILVAKGWWAALSGVRVADGTVPHEESAEQDADSGFPTDEKIGVPPMDRWRMGRIHEGDAIKVFSSRHSIDP